LPPTTVTVVDPVTKGTLCAQATPVNNVARNTQDRGLTVVGTWPY
jgi:hypothetical protein